MDETSRKGCLLQNQQVMKNETTQNTIDTYTDSEGNEYPNITHLGAIDDNIIDMTFEDFETPMYEDWDGIKHKVNQQAMKKLTLNDFVQMVRDDMMVGSSTDEKPSDEQVRKKSKAYYNYYLQGASVDDLF